MKKKLSKVLAVVLSLAMVLGLAAVDTTSVGQAAKKLKFTKTGKEAVKSGQKRTLKISGTKAKKAKWTVTGTGKQYIKLAKKKGKTNSFTVKANATGKAKITAKLTKKNKVSVTYTLSCDLEGIAFDEASAAANVETGATANLKLTGVPSNAAVPTATYAVWMDAEKTTVVPETTTVTAAAVEGGVDFTASVAGTYYVVATAGDFEATAVVTVKDHVAVLKEVKQTKLNELVLTFDSDCTYIKETDDIKIVDNNGTRHDVKTITFDKDDKTKATVTVLVDLNDGKENSVEYKGTEVKFTASNGEVTNVKLNVEQAPIKTTVPLKGLFLDANGVEVKEVKYGDYSNEKFEITVETTGEASEDSGNNAIRMEALTDTVKVTAVYRSGKLDPTTLEPVEFRQTFVITAIAEGQISGVKEYTIWDSKDGDEQKYSDLKDADKNNHEIKVDITETNVKELYALVVDDLGYTKVDGSLTAAGYTLSSADDTILQVNGDLLQGNREGTTRVLVADDQGNVKFTIPVKVLAAPQLKSFTVDKSTIILSAGNFLNADKRNNDWKGDSSDVKVVPLDQYGNVYKDVSISVYNPESASKNFRGLYNNWKDGANIKYDEDGKNFPVTVEVTGMIPDEEYNADTAKGSLKAGKSHSNTYTIEVKDKEFDTTLNKTVYVTTKQPKYDNVKTIKLDAPATIDTTLTKSHNSASSNKNFQKEIKVALYDGNGVFVAYDYIAVTRNAVTITKNGKTYKATNSDKDNYVINDGSNIWGNKNVTLGAIYFDTNEANGVGTTTAAAMNFVYRSHKDASGYTLATGVPAQPQVVQKLEAGRYTIKVANIKVNSAGGKQEIFKSKDTTCVTLGAASTNVVAATIKVEDKQAVPTLTQIKKSLSTVSVEDALKNAFKVECADTDDDNTSYDPAKIEKGESTGIYLLSEVEKAYVSNEKGVSFTKIKVFVPYPCEVSGDKVTDYLYVENTLSAPYAVKAE